MIITNHIKLLSCKKCNHNISITNCDVYSKNSVWCTLMKQKKTSKMSIFSYNLMTW